MMPEGAKSSAFGFWLQYCANMNEFQKKIEVIRYFTDNSARRGDKMSSPKRR